MKLSLKRWDSPAGHTAGFWPIKELPGFMLIRNHCGWIIYCGDPYIRLDACRIPIEPWGKSYTPDYETYAKLPEAMLMRPYPTRWEALMALEIEITRLAGLAEDPKGKNPDPVNSRK